MLSLLVVVKVNGKFNHICENLVLVPATSKLCFS